MAKELLIETIQFEVSPLLVEQSFKDNGGRLIVKGVLQRANQKNQNGRIYPKEILVREVKRYDDEFVKGNRALGSLDHENESYVSLRNASHRVLEMYWENDDLIGKVEILGTPAGNILKELFKAGVTLGISSRGLGTVKELHEVDALEVQNDFELISFDFVSNPSTHGAFLRPISESVSKQDQGYNKVNSIISNIICDVTNVCCLN